MTNPTLKTSGIMPEFILLTPDPKPPYPIYTTQDEVAECALSADAGTTIWEKIGVVKSEIQWIGGLPDPPLARIYTHRRRRRTMPEKATEKPATASSGIEASIFTVEAVSTGQESDGFWRCAIVTNQGKAVRQSTTLQSAVAHAEVAVGIMSDADFNDLPDTEGKRQLAKARKG